MRIVSPYTVLAFVVVWTIIILLASRQFLFNAHQVSWFQHEEQKMVQELSVKLDNLDSRDTRQLNAVYAEVKRVEGKRL
jgi:hypothetical protein